MLYSFFSVVGIKHSSNRCIKKRVFNDDVFIGIGVYDDRAEECQLSGRLAGTGN